MKRYLRFTLVIGLVACLGGLAEGASANPKSGGTLTMGMRKDITVLNPLVRTFSTDERVRDLMFESLLTLDEQGRVQPLLAESWEISGDGRTYTFKLRQGVKFHNGQEMTAEDAKFAIDYAMNPTNGAYGVQMLALVEKVETRDKHTLTISLRRPSAAFLSILTDIRAFCLIPEGAVEAGRTKPDTFPPGTGPFKFMQWQPNQRIVFDRFEDYWGRKAHLNRVILRPIRNATVRFTALRAGDVDLVERAPYEWVKQVQAGKVKGIQVVQAPHAAFRKMIFNVVGPPFDDKTLRLAVAHAIDKKEILNAAYFGFGKPADQKYPKGHTWYLQNVPSPQYDPAESKRLLQLAGYRGEVIPMNVSGDVVETMAAVLQAQLKRVGMNIKIQVFDYGARRDQIRKGETTLDFAGDGFFADPTTTYDQETACEADSKKRITNWTGYCNKELDALQTQLETEMREPERRALLKKILTIKNRDLPLLPIGFAPRFFALRSSVKGFTTNGEGDFQWSGGGLSRTWLDH